MALSESNYVYVIAGGNTLAFIDSVKSKADMAVIDIKALAETFGVAASVDFARLRFSYDGSSPPQGWAVNWTEDKGKFCKPDKKTDVGRGIAWKIDQCVPRLDIQGHFNTLCMRYCPHTVVGSYGFEELSGATIVRCPPSISKPAVYAVPPDSTVLLFSQYAQMREQMNGSGTKKAIRFMRDFG